ncbi:cupin-like domain-containing protein [Xanthomonas hyacinthi]|uniref:cupin-like domain-containing protein n=1 Tax=Xanthomonas hyacinthi TaxID=56455 RepID=UPI00062DC724|nr:hypothetical protein Y886_05600 [Xanthomonas hyacinthi DSM 19077]
MAALAAIAERSDCRAGALPLADLLAAGAPVVLRGLARDWALVQAGLHSTGAAMELLRGHSNGRTLPYSSGAPEIAGRPFYTDDFTALNFEVRRDDLHGLLDAIARSGPDRSSRTASAAAPMRAPTRRGGTRRARHDYHPGAALFESSRA